MNVRYYVAPPGAPAPGPGLRRVYDEADARVYEDRAALPRAYLVPATRPMSDAAALGLLARGGVDPRREAIVPRDAPAATGSGFGALDARRIDATHWRVSLPPGAGGWLVLANAYSPDWRAKVDGKETDLYPTDYAATGLPVPRGARTVDVELDRTRINAAAAISGLGLLATAILLVANPFATRRR
jgi:hypothetical protein